MTYITLVGKSRLLSSSDLGLDLDFTILCEQVILTFLNMRFLFFAVQFACPATYHCSQVLDIYYASIHSSFPELAFVLNLCYFDLIMLNFKQPYIQFLSQCLPPEDFQESLNISNSDFLVPSLTPLTLHEEFQQFGFPSQ